MLTTFKLKMNAPYLYVRLTFITGRNEVVAKVMFYRCVSVHRGGGGRVSASVHAGMPDPPPDQTGPPGSGRHPPDQADPPGSARHPPDQADPPGPARPPRQGRPPRTSQTPPGQADYPPDKADPPGKQTPAYSLRAAGTHPTGMHSCSLCNDNSKQPRKTPYNIVLTLHKKCSN